MRPSLRDVEFFVFIVAAVAFDEPRVEKLFICISVR
jgi:hypothetical protein